MTEKPSILKGSDLVDEVKSDLFAVEKRLKRVLDPLVVIEAFNSKLKDKVLVDQAAFLEEAKSGGLCRFVVKMIAEGRVTIPKNYRELFELSEGDQVEIDLLQVIRRAK